MEPDHTDLSGPYEASMGGSAYIIVFVDNDRGGCGRMERRRSRRGPCFPHVPCGYGRHMDRKHRFRTDKGGPFTSRSYVDYCDSAGICREYKIAEKPQQHAVMERAICRAIEGGMRLVTRTRACSQASTSRRSPTSAPAAIGCGWSLFFGLRAASTAPHPRPTLDGGRCTKSCSRGCLTYRWSLFSSIECCG